MYHNRSGFTLIEMILVITMILIMMAISLFPYDYYMDRARVEKNIDMIAQEWILAHNDIKNGILYDSGTHAHFYIHFPIGANEIDIYMSSGGLDSEKPYRQFKFDKNITILSFSGIDIGSNTGISYHIAPPYGYGSFFTSTTELSLTGIYMTIGYPGAGLEGGRAKQILLRPYY